MKKITSALLFLAIQTTIASASTLNYKCTSYMINGERRSDQIMILSISEQEAFGDILNESWDDNLIGGKSSNKNKTIRQLIYSKYNNLLVEESLKTGGRKLEDGSVGGFARFESEIEGGYTQYKFICTRLF